MIALLLLACAPDLLDLEVAVVEGGFEVVATLPLDRVEVVDASGLPVVGRSLPSPAAAVSLLAPWEPGERYRIRARSGGQARERAVEAPGPVGPVRVEVEAPIGQGRRSLSQGASIPLVLVEGAPAEVALFLTAREPTTAEVRLGDVRRRIELPVAGAPVTVRASVVGPGEVEVRVDGISARIVPSVLSGDEARARLQVVAIRFPVDPTGRPDTARSPDRIALPARWWEGALRAVRLGYRPRDDQAPWAFQSVTLRNLGDQPMNVAVRATVDHPAFRSRVRDADVGTGETAALLRVPANGLATAVLPVFVDRPLLPPGTLRATRRIAVAPLGSAAPLHVVERPLVLTRGSAYASAGFAAAVLASLLGLGALLRRGPRWLAEARTTELVTIALFGSLTFVVATASQLVGHGLAALLGPFAPLVTGIFDDAFRTCLLATLLVLVPRPGVVTLAALVGYLMRGLALGALHPMDALYLGSTVFWLEGCLWLAGLTRGGGAWRDEGRMSRFSRLSAGFGVAQLLSAACGLALSAVLYRLFLADWYVALMIGLPGFLYVLVGCWLAVDFSASLRRVES